MQECEPMPGALSARFRRGSAIVIAAVSTACLGCGGDPKAEPTPDDVDAVASAVADIVFQCGTFTAGHVAAPDAEALERDVDALVGAAGRLQPDASFEIGAAAGIPRATSLREELRFGARVLEDGCLPEQAERLRKAAG
jgi:hypothetical protein